MSESKRERSLRKIEEIQELSAKGKRGSIMEFLVDAVVWLLHDRIDQLVKEANDESK